MKKSALGLIAGAGAALALTPSAFAAENPFGLKDANGAAVIVVAGDEKKGISVLEGKCGSGKCGSQRVRQMMDRNGDGKINREEYVDWAVRQAGNEFDGFASGKDAVSPDDVYKHFESLTADIG